MPIEEAEVCRPGRSKERNGPDGILGTSTLGVTYSPPFTQVYFGEL